MKSIFGDTVEDDIEDKLNIVRVIRQQVISITEKVVLKHQKKAWIIGLQKQLCGEVKAEWPKWIQHERSNDFLILGLEDMMDSCVPNRDLR